MGIMLEKDFSVNAAQTIKIGDGDILFVDVAPETSVDCVKWAREALQNEIKEVLGVKVVVVITCGGTAVGIAKRDELDDIYKRLDALEKK